MISKPYIPGALAVLVTAVILAVFLMLHACSRELSRDKKSDDMKFVEHYVLEADANAVQVPPFDPAPIYRMDEDVIMHLVDQYNTVGDEARLCIIYTVVDVYEGQDILTMKLIKRLLNYIKDDVLILDYLRFRIKDSQVKYGREVAEYLDVIQAHEEEFIKRRGVQKPRQTVPEVD